MEAGQSRTNFANLPEAEAIRLKGQSALKDARTEGALASFALSAWGFSPKLTGYQSSMRLPYHWFTRYAIHGSLAFMRACGRPR